MYKGIIILTLIAASSAQYLRNGCPSDSSPLFLPHLSDCNKYYKCSNGEKIETNCPTGALFDSDLQGCSLAIFVTCVPGSTAPVSDELLSFAIDCSDLAVKILLPHDSDCEKYYKCDDGQKLEMSCDPGAAFDFMAQDCHEGVTCTTTTIPTTTTTELTTTTEPTTTTTTASPPTTKSSPTSYLLPHEGDCSKYYKCVKGEKVGMDCSPGTAFDFSKQACSANAKCTLSAVNEPPATETETTTTPSITTTEAITTTTEPSTTTTISTTVTDEPITVFLSTIEITTGFLRIQAGLEFLPNGCPAEPETEPPPVNNMIFIDYYLPHDSQCSKYYRCVGGNKVEKDCSPGTWFDADSQACKNPATVKCAHNEEIPTTSEVITTTTSEEITTTETPTTTAEMTTTEYLTTEIPTTIVVTTDNITVFNEISTENTFTTVITTTGISLPEYLRAQDIQYLPNGCPIRPRVKGRPGRPRIVKVPGKPKIKKPAIKPIIVNVESTTLNIIAPEDDLTTTPHEFFSAEECNDGDCNIVEETSPSDDILTENIEDSQSGTDDLLESNSETPEEPKAEESLNTVVSESETEAAGQENIPEEAAGDMEETMSDNDQETVDSSIKEEDTYIEVADLPAASIPVEEELEESVLGNDQETGEDSVTEAMAVEPIILPANLPLEEIAGELSDKTTIEKLEITATTSLEEVKVETSLDVTLPENDIVTESESGSEAAEEIMEMGVNTLTILDELYDTLDVTEGPVEAASVLPENLTPGVEETIAEATSLEESKETLPVINQTVEEESVIDEVKETVVQDNKVPGVENSETMAEGDLVDKPGFAEEPSILPVNSLPDETEEVHQENEEQTTKNVQAVAEESESETVDLLVESISETAEVSDLTEDFLGEESLEILPVTDHIVGAESVTKSVDEVADSVSEPVEQSLVEITETAAEDENEAESVDEEPSVLPVNSSPEEVPEDIKEIVPENASTIKDESETEADLLVESITIIEETSEEQTNKSSASVSETKEESMDDEKVIQESGVEATDIPVEIIPEATEKSLSEGSIAETSVLEPVEAQKDKETQVPDELQELISETTAILGEGTESGEETVTFTEIEGYAEEPDFLPVNLSLDEAVDDTPAEVSESDQMNTDDAGTELVEHTSQAAEIVLGEELVETELNLEVTEESLVEDTEKLSESDQSTAGGLETQTAGEISIIKETETISKEPGIASVDLLPDEAADNKPIPEVSEMSLEEKTLLPESVSQTSDESLAEMFTEIDLSTIEAINDVTEVIITTTKASLVGSESVLETVSETEMDDIIEESGILPVNIPLDEAQDGNMEVEPVSLGDETKEPDSVSETTEKSLGEEITETIFEYYQSTAEGFDIEEADEVTEVILKTTEASQVKDTDNVDQSNLSTEIDAKESGFVQPVNLSLEEQVEETTVAVSETDQIAAEYSETEAVGLPIESVPDKTETSLSEETVQILSAVEPSEQSLGGEFTEMLFESFQSTPEGSETKAADEVATETTLIEETENVPDTDMSEEQGMVPVNLPPEEAANEITETVIESDQDLLDEPVSETAKEATKGIILLEETTNGITKVTDGAGMDATDSFSEPISAATDTVLEKDNSQTELMSEHSEKILEEGISETILEDDQLLSESQVADEVSEGITETTAAMFKKTETVPEMSEISNAEFDGTTEKPGDVAMNLPLEEEAYVSTLAEVEGDVDLTGATGTEAIDSITESTSGATNTTFDKETGQQGHILESTKISEEEMTIGVETSTAASESDQDTDYSIQPFSVTMEIAIGGESIQPDFVSESTEKSQTEITDETALELSQTDPITTVDEETESAFVAVNSPLEEETDATASELVESENVSSEVMQTVTIDSTVEQISGVLVTALETENEQQESDEKVTTDSLLESEKSTFEAMSETIETALPENTKTIPQTTSDTEINEFTDEPGFVAANLPLEETDDKSTVAISEGDQVSTETLGTETNILTTEPISEATDTVLGEETEHSKSTEKSIEEVAMDLSLESDQTTAAGSETQVDSEISGDILETTQGLFSEIIQSEEDTISDSDTNGSTDEPGFIVMNLPLEDTADETTVTVSNAEQVSTETSETKATDSMTELLLESTDTFLGEEIQHDSLLQSDRTTVEVPETQTDRETTKSDNLSIEILETEASYPITESILEVTDTTLGKETEKSVSSVKADDLITTDLLLGSDQTTAENSETTEVSSSDITENVGETISDLVISGSTDEPGFVVVNLPFEDIVDEMTMSVSDGDQVTMETLGTEVTDSMMEILSEVTDTALVEKTKNLESTQNSNKEVTTTDPLFDSDQPTASEGVSTEMLEMEATDISTQPISEPTDTILENETEPTEKSDEEMTTDSLLESDQTTAEDSETQLDDSKMSEDILETTEALLNEITEIDAETTLDSGLSNFKEEPGFLAVNLSLENIIDETSVAVTDSNEVSTETFVIESTSLTTEPLLEATDIALENETSEPTEKPDDDVTADSLLENDTISAEDLEIHKDGESFESDGVSTEMLETELSDLLSEPIPEATDTTLGEEIEQPESTENSEEEVTTDLLLVSDQTTAESSKTTIVLLNDITENVEEAVSDSNINGSTEELGFVAVNLPLEETADKTAVTISDINQVSTETLAMEVTDSTAEPLLEATEKVSVVEIEQSASTEKIDEEITTDSLLESDQTTVENLEAQVDNELAADEVVSIQTLDTKASDLTTQPISEATDTILKEETEQLAFTEKLDEEMATDSSSLGSDITTSKGPEIEAETSAGEGFSTEMLDMESSDSTIQPTSEAADTILGEEIEQLASTEKQSLEVITIDMLLDSERTTVEDSTTPETSINENTETVEDVDSDVEISGSTDESGFLVVNLPLEDILDEMTAGVSLADQVSTETLGTYVTDSTMEPLFETEDSVLVEETEQSDLTEKTDQVVTTDSLLQSDKTTEEVLETEKDAETSETDNVSTVMSEVEASDGETKQSESTVKSDEVVTPDSLLENDQTTSKGLETKNDIEMFEGALTEIFKTKSSDSTTGSILEAMITALAEETVQPKSTEKSNEDVTTDSLIASDQTTSDDLDPQSDVETSKGDTSIEKFQTDSFDATTELLLENMITALGEETEQSESTDNFDEKIATSEQTAAEGSETQVLSETTVAMLNEIAETEGETVTDTEISDSSDEPGIVAVNLPLEDIVHETTLAMSDSDQVSTETLETQVTDSTTEPLSEITDTSVLKETEKSDEDVATESLLESDQAIAEGSGSANGSTDKSEIAASYSTIELMTEATNTTLGADTEQPKSTEISEDEVTTDSLLESDQTTAEVSETQVDSEISGDNTETTEELLHEFTETETETVSDTKIIISSEEPSFVVVNLPIEDIVDETSLTVSGDDQISTEPLGTEVVDSTAEPSSQVTDTAFVEKTEQSDSTEISNEEVITETFIESDQTDSEGLETRTEVKSSLGDYSLTEMLQTHADDFTTRSILDTTSTVLEDETEESASTENVDQKVTTDSLLESDQTTAENSKIQVDNGISGEITEITEASLNEITGTEAETVFDSGISGSTDEPGFVDITDEPVVLASDDDQVSTEALGNEVTDSTTMSLSQTTDTTLIEETLQSESTKKPDKGGTTDSLFDINQSTSESSETQAASETSEEDIASTEILQTETSDFTTGPIIEATSTDLGEEVEQSESTENIDEKVTTDLLLESDQKTAEDSETQVDSEVSLDITVTTEASLNDITETETETVFDIEINGSTDKPGFVAVNIPLENIVEETTVAVSDSDQVSIGTLGAGGTDSMTEPLSEVKDSTSVKETEQSEKSNEEGTTDSLFEIDQSTAEGSETQATGETSEGDGVSTEMLATEATASIVTDTTLGEYTEQQASTGKSLEEITTESLHVSDQTIITKGSELTESFLNENTEIVGETDFDTEINGSTEEPGFVVVNLPLEDIVDDTSAAVTDEGQILTEIVQMESNILTTDPLLEATDTASEDETEQSEPTEQFDEGVTTGSLLESDKTTVEDSDTQADGKTSTDDDVSTELTESSGSSTQLISEATDIILEEETEQLASTAKSVEGITTDSLFGSGQTTAEGSETTEAMLNDITETVGEMGSDVQISSSTDVPGFLAVNSPLEDIVDETSVSVTDGDQVSTEALGMEITDSTMESLSEAIDTVSVDETEQSELTEKSYEEVTTDSIFKIDQSTGETPETQATGQMSEGFSVSKDMAEIQASNSTTESMLDTTNMTLGEDIEQPKSSLTSEEEITLNSLLESDQTTAESSEAQVESEILGDIIETTEALSNKITETVRETDSNIEIAGYTERPGFLAVNLPLEDKVDETTTAISDGDQVSTETFGTEATAGTALEDDTEKSESAAKSDEEVTTDSLLESDKTTTENSEAVADAETSEGFNVSTETLDVEAPDSTTDLISKATDIAIGENIKFEQLDSTEKSDEEVTTDTGLVNDQAISEGSETQADSEITGSILQTTESLLNEITNTLGELDFKTEISVSADEPGFIAVNLPMEDTTDGIIVSVSDGDQVSIETLESEVTDLTTEPLLAASDTFSEIYIDALLESDLSSSEGSVTKTDGETSAGDDVSTEMLETEATDSSTEFLSQATDIALGDENEQSELTENSDEELTTDSLIGSEQLTSEASETQAGFELSKEMSQTTEASVNENSEAVVDTISDTESIDSIDEPGFVAVNLPVEEAADETTLAVSEVDQNFELEVTDSITEYLTQATETILSKITEQPESTEKSDDEITTDSLLVSEQSITEGSETQADGEKPVGLSETTEELLNENTETEEEAVFEIEFSSSSDEPGFVAVNLSQEEADDETTLGVSESDPISTTESGTEASDLVSESLSVATVTASVEIEQSESIEKNYEDLIADSLLNKEKSTAEASGTQAATETIEDDNVSTENSETEALDSITEPLSEDMNPSMGEETVQAETTEKSDEQATADSLFEIGQSPAEGLETLATDGVSEETLEPSVLENTEINAQIVSVAEVEDNTEKPSNSAVNLPVENDADKVTIIVSTGDQISTVDLETEAFDLVNEFPSEATGSSLGEDIIEQEIIPGNSDEPLQEGTIQSILGGQSTAEGLGTQSANEVSDETLETAEIIESTDAAEIVPVSEMESAEEAGIVPVNLSVEEIAGKTPVEESDGDQLESEVTESEAVVSISESVGTDTALEEETVYLESVSEPTEESQEGGSTETVSETEQSTAAVPSCPGGYVGNMPHPDLCNFFYKCDGGEESQLTPCADGFEFNSEAKECLPIAEGGCTLSITTTVDTTTEGISESTDFIPEILTESAAEVIESETLVEASKPISEDSLGTGAIIEGSETEAVVDEMAQTETEVNADVIETEGIMEESALTEFIPEVQIPESDYAGESEIETTSLSIPLMPVNLPIEINVEGAVDTVEKATELQTEISEEGEAVEAIEEAVETEAVTEGGEIMEGDEVSDTIVTEFTDIKPCDLNEYCTSLPVNTEESKVEAVTRLPELVSEVTDMLVEENVATESAAIQEIQADDVVTEFASESSTEQAPKSASEVTHILVEENVLTELAVIQEIQADDLETELALEESESVTQELPSDSDETIINNVVTLKDVVTESALDEETITINDVVDSATVVENFEASATDLPESASEAEETEVKAATELPETNSEITTELALVSEVQSDHILTELALESSTEQAIESDSEVTNVMFEENVATELAIIQEIHADDVVMELANEESDFITQEIFSDSDEMVTDFAITAKELEDIVTQLPLELTLEEEPITEIIAKVNNGVVDSAIAEENLDDSATYSPESAAEVEETEIEAATVLPESDSQVANILLEENVATELDIIQDIQAYDILTEQTPESSNIITQDTLSDSDETVTNIVVTVHESEDVVTKPPSELLDEEETVSEVNQGIDSALGAENFEDSASDLLESASEAAGNEQVIKPANTVEGSEAKEIDSANDDGTIADESKGGENNLPPEPGIVLVMADPGNIEPIESISDIATTVETILDSTIISEESNPVTDLPPELIAEAEEAIVENEDGNEITEAFTDSHDEGEGETEDLSEELTTEAETTTTKKKASGQKVRRKTTTTTTTIPPETTTETPICPDGYVGNIPHPDLCNYYYQCDGAEEPVMSSCDDGFEFDDNTKECIVSEGGCIPENMTITDIIPTTDVSTPVAAEAEVTTSEVAAEAEVTTSEVTETKACKDNSDGCNADQITETITEILETKATELQTETTIAEKTVAEETTVSTTTKKKPRKLVAKIRRKTTTTTTTEPPTTTPAPMCPYGFDGKLADPEICNYYIKCDGIGNPVMIPCEDGFEFDSSKEECVPTIIGGSCIPDVTTPAPTTGTPKRKKSGKKRVQPKTTSLKPTTTRRPICPIGYVGNRGHAGLCNYFFKCDGSGNPNLTPCADGYEFSLRKADCVLISENGDCMPEDIPAPKPPKQANETEPEMPELTYSGLKIRRKPRSTTTTTTEPTTEELTTTEESLCPVGFVGNIAHPELCSYFYKCDGNGVPVLSLCEEELEFDPDQEICVPVSEEGCSSGTKSIEGEEIRTTPFTEQTTDSPTTPPPTTEPTTTEATTTEPTTPEPTTTEEVTTLRPECELGFTGNIAHSENCNQFFTCASGGPLMMFCSTGEEFDPVAQICVQITEDGCTFKKTLNNNETNSAVEVTTSSAVTNTGPARRSSNLFRRKMDFSCLVGMVDSVPDPGQCNSFFVCSDRIVLHLYCPRGFEFDPYTKVCVSISEYGCTARSSLLRSLAEQIPPDQLNRRA